MIYNLGLSAGYLVIVYYLLTESPARFLQNAFELFRNPGMLLPLWTIFVTLSSAYYFKFSLFGKKPVLY